MHVGGKPGEELRSTSDQQILLTRLLKPSFQSKYRHPIEPL